MSSKKLIRLGQSLEQKYQLGEEPLTTTDKWIEAPADDGYIEKELTELDKLKSK